MSEIPPFALTGIRNPNFGNTPDWSKLVLIGFLISQCWQIGNLILVILPIGSLIFGDAPDQESNILTLGNWEPDFSDAPNQSQSVPIRSPILVIIPIFCDELMESKN